MRILVTNDDGIHAEGLWTLATSLARLGDVTVVAPDREQSGVGTALSLGRHIRVHRVTPPREGISAYAVEGTPGDAVILAIHAIVGEPIDAVVSGINLGANVGNDTVVSGTVGAALQGFFNGIFSVAVSLASLTEPHWDVAAAFATELVAGRKRGDLPHDVFLNLNLPNLPREQIGRCRVLPLGEQSYLHAIEEHLNKKGQTSYQIVYGRPTEAVAEGTDVWGLRNNYAVVTPLRRELQGDARWQALETFVDAAWDRLQ